MKISKQIARALAENLQIELDKIGKQKAKSNADAIYNDSIAKEINTILSKINVMRKQSDEFEEKAEELLDILKEKFPNNRLDIRQNKLNVNVGSSCSTELEKLTNDILIANHVNNIEPDKISEYILSKNK